VHGDDDSPLEIDMKKARSLVPQIAASFATLMHDLYQQDNLAEARRVRKDGIYHLMLADLSMSEATASRILSDSFRTLMEV
jgi:nitrogen fixation/metabolism regulation signal transduction histidine kinase